MEEFTTPIFTVAHKWPYPKKGKCDNCRKKPEKISRCKIFGWKTVYICQDCEGKFFDRIRELNELSIDTSDLGFEVQKTYINGGKK